MRERPTVQRSAPAIPAHDPAQERRLVVCPDCAAISDARRCRPQDFGPLGIFVACPECGIGSSIREWKQGRWS